MIPAETSDFASLTGGIASLNHRLNNDDALRATGFRAATAGNGLSCGYCGQQAFVRLLRATGFRAATAGNGLSVGLLRATGFRAATAGGRLVRRGCSGSSQTGLFRRRSRSCSNRRLCGCLSSRGLRSQTVSRVAGNAPRRCLHDIG